MRNNFIVLATPRVHSLMCEDLRLVAKVNKRLDEFLENGLPSEQAGRDVFVFFVQREPMAAIVFLTGSGNDDPDFLIISGAKDGMGPTDRDVECKAKGVFPTKAAIRAGSWAPLIQIHIT